ncbi:pyridoxamine 5'-phosphate oxidase family protein [Microbacterium sp. BK668]|uniref:pyridoxamine 5'-phosphate oxidase family protein n=1 Tax=Microbacterium sp. BK668 TaxID=2512118 RepID=UPI00105DB1EB|nr:pyridoxamine 5'-phosphate oxidase family protein [Microbacterium sp. BK668]TDN91513.1 pyridoxamine 5'-phosphate oxidase [Microbacterium sp. BK668]
MSVSTHDVTLLEDPVAQQLLAAPVLARFAYTWSDGTPRVVPMWFHWDGRYVVVASPPGAPKLKVLGERPDVAVTIDTDGWPYRVLSIRGRAEMEMLDDVAPEYAAAAERYFGEEQGRAWVGQLRGRPMCRIRVVPEWVNVLDFETRLPSALTL